MAVAPIQNPINASPIESPNGESLDQRAQAQREHLTPGNIGEQLAGQFAEHAETINQSVNQAVSTVATQANSDIEAMRSQIETLNTALNTALANQQNQQPAPPPVNYDYDQNELAELGQRLPQTIDKRAQFAATQMKDEAVREATTQSSQQIQALEAEINALKQGQSQIQSQNKTAFRAQAMSLAAAHGLSMTTLKDDASWVDMLKETADPISGVTYHQYLTTAIQNEDPTILGQLFEQHASRQRAAKQSQHSASPQPMGGAPRVAADGGGEDLNVLQNQINDIYAKQKELRNQRMSAQISVEQFQSQMQTLTNDMAAVQGKLQQFYN